MQLLKEVPLYNDVMLPSTSEKLVLPLSPLPPSEPLHVASTTLEDAQGKRCILDSSATPASSSVVKLITVYLPFEEINIYSGSMSTEKGNHFIPTPF